MDQRQYPLQRPIIKVVIPKEDWLAIWTRISPNQDPRAPDVEGIIQDAGTHWVQILSNSEPAQEESRILKFPISDHAKQALREAFTRR